MSAVSDSASLQYAESPVDDRDLTGQAEKAVGKPFLERGLAQAVPSALGWTPRA
ncbi:hypothetical protein [Streptomyces sp. NPDC002491]